ARDHLPDLAPPSLGRAGLPPGLRALRPPADEGAGPGRRPLHRFRQHRRHQRAQDGQQGRGSRHPPPRRRQGRPGRPPRPRPGRGGCGDARGFHRLPRPLLPRLARLQGWQGRGHLPGHAPGRGLAPGPPRLRHLGRHLRGAAHLLGLGACRGRPVAPLGRAPRPPRRGAPLPRPRRADPHPPPRQHLPPPRGDRAARRTAL
ncbi:MAG: Acyl-phosphate:glycerol-3-phosphate O-acyltransferase PlsY (EC, partial [uncultured Rubellimicrobium sp.]